MESIKLMQPTTVKSVIRKALHMSKVVTVIVVLLMVIVSCVALKDRIADLIGNAPASIDRVLYQAWSHELGVDDLTLANYILESQGDIDRLRAREDIWTNQVIVSTEPVLRRQPQPNWLAFLPRERQERTDLENMVSLRGGTIAAHLETKWALREIEKAMKNVQMEYAKDDHQRFRGRAYSGLLAKLSEYDLSRGQIQSDTEIKSPFITVSDADIWVVISRFLSDFRQEVELSSDLRPLFRGVRVDAPLQIVDRIRNTPAVYELMRLDTPSYHALEALLRELERSISAPAR